MATTPDFMAIYQVQHDDDNYNANNDGSFMTGRVTPLTSSSSSSTLSCNFPPQFGNSGCGDGGVGGGATSGGGDNAGCFSWFMAPSSIKPTTDDVGTTATATRGVVIPSPLSVTATGASIIAANSSGSSSTSSPTHAKVDAVNDDSDLVTQIAKELSTLTFNERNSLNEEIHGVVTLPDEDTNTLEQKLEELDMELLLLASGSSSNTGSGSANNTSPYERALSQNPDYVSGKQFRLMFLRGYGYNPQLAAQHIIHHFEWKYKLFVERMGESSKDNPNNDNMATAAGSSDDSLLGRPLTLDDLSETDMKVLESGKNLFLPGLDTARRRVFMYCEDLLNTRHFESMVRLSESCQ